jgi:tripartite-type tricarboxylate transporter receptor subunit TctC
MTSVVCHPHETLMHLKSFCTLLLLALVTALPTAHAQPTNSTNPWPNKPVRVIVPFAPGGGTDVVARFIAPKLAEEFGQQFIIDNRPGAGGSIGVDLVVRANPDGYTILIGASSYTSNAALYKLSYDPIKGFTPVSLITRGPFVVTVHPSLKVGALKELLDLAQAKPNAITYGTSGPGSVPHLAIEGFQQMAKIKMTHAPYKGDGPAIIDLLGGHIQFYYGGPLVISGHINSGKLRGLAVTTEKRSYLFPDLPAVAETLPGYSAMTWFGLWVPLGTPQDIVTRLNQALGRALKQPDIQERLRANGMESGYGTPAAFSQFIAEEIAKYSRIVKAGNIRVE